MMKIMMKTMAVAAFALATGNLQAHGSGYWGPEVQRQLNVQVLKMGGYGDFSQFSDVEVRNIGKMFGAPVNVLKSAYATRTWLACYTLKVMRGCN
jgi:hypothetical protein